MSTHDNSAAGKYVKSLKDALKQKYAQTYLDWIRAGRKGDMPSRGLLAPALAKSVSANLDSIA